MENNKPIPTPGEWAGGVENFERLTEVFYDKVLQDNLLEPVSKHLPDEHRKHVAHFMVEVLKGRKPYN